MTQNEVGKRRGREHPYPTDATYKQIYGTAFRCGKPGCGQPLYRVSDETSEWILNSEVAHICARREHGPRWDPDMAEEQNRHFDNLIALCEPHATEIDKTPEHYPVQLLKAWKARQLAECERTQKSWPISDNQVREVAISSRDLDDAVDRISRLIPFSPRMRSRQQALDHAWRRGDARRRIRLQAVVPDHIVDSVLCWMEDAHDRIEVPCGQLKVAVAPMGSGKTELASRWWDGGLDAAVQGEAEIPVWLHVRDVREGLEPAITTAISGDPDRPVRVVLDNLDHLGRQSAALLLDEARELVRVWPNLAVLATSRFASTATKSELITVEPWPKKRGSELLQLVTDRGVPWTNWTAETLDLLRRPLTTLALAAHLNSGGEAKTSRTEVLAQLARHLLRDRFRNQATQRIWADLRLLAVRILNSGQAVRADTFGDEPSVWDLLDTHLVAEDDGKLAFVLPLFEQHFGAQAITHGSVQIEQCCRSVPFRRWRYAVATAISNAQDADAEHMVATAARVNPAAASWILDEIPLHSAYTEHVRDTTNASMDAQIRGLWSDSNPPRDTSVLVGQWLRQAQQAYLDGFGHLGTLLARHHNGKPTRWGVLLHDEWLNLAVATEITAEPEVVLLPEGQPDITRRSGWYTWQICTVPDARLGRWLWAREKLRGKLDKLLSERALPMDRPGRLYEERRWFLADHLLHPSYGRHVRKIAVADLKANLSELMVRVNDAYEFTQQARGHQIRSADIRWLQTQIDGFDDEFLDAPWPDEDVKNRPWRKGMSWAWEACSPQLSTEITAAVIHHALIGYRDLVEIHFSTIADSLDLYVMMPVHAEGMIYRFDGTDTRREAGVLFALRRVAGGRAQVPTVALDLVTDSESEQRWEFSQALRAQLDDGGRPSKVEDLDLPLRSSRPATNLAYRWLARDLKAVGWLKDDLRFRD